MRQKKLSRPAPTHAGTPGKPSAGRKSVSVELVISVAAVASASMVRATPYTFVHGLVSASVWPTCRGESASDVEPHDRARHGRSALDPRPCPWHRLLPDESDITAEGRSGRAV